MAPPTLMPSGYVPTPVGHLAGGTSLSASAGAGAGQPVGDAQRIMQMIKAFQYKGHLLSTLDPLGMMGPRDATVAADLKLERYGFTPADLKKEFNLAFMSGIEGFFGEGRPTVTLEHIYRRLTETYTSNIGWEYMHIPSVEECNWIRDKIETQERHKYSKAEKVAILKRLAWSEHFERFLATKYATAKRFGLEGGETACDSLVGVIEKLADLGCKNVNLGMPHRGRLNVLGTVIQKPLEVIYSEFAGNPEMFVPTNAGDGTKLGTGDVKYHMGASGDRVTPAGNTIHCSLSPNPSHLETVNPIVMGKTKAKQFYTDDDKADFSASILMHGDAAFAGQGIVSECLSFARLPNYSVGGTIHLVVNNQVGFTTDASRARSGVYCTDVAKGGDVPVFHVNGDDPEAVHFVSTLAAEYRMRFKKDVVIDLVCYRKNGHNEIDEPSFTQPLMYKRVAQMKNVWQLYSEKLIAEGSLAQAEVDAISKEVMDTMTAKFEESKSLRNKPKDWLLGEWSDMKTFSELSSKQATAVEMQTLKKIGKTICTYPADFNIHKRLKGVMDKKKESVESGEGIDWATAEALAFGSLLLEGNHVRLSGQDVERGTFSHRHAAMHDQVTNVKFEPLNHLSASQAKFTVSCSNLSEYGVLGFELGYAMGNPHALVLWEAQFGDFSNGAQIILDNYLSSMEHKWLRQCGLTLLLPHGFEGQGPEHSSCRMERYLQMTCDDERVMSAKDSAKSLQIQQSNWQVVNCSTPANYFHVLRRQLCREFRKPLVIATPKSLLRHPLAKSSMAEMAEGSKFHKIIAEQDAAVVANGDKVKKLIFCSGKVFYDLLEKRMKGGQTDVAIARVEQIAPFPHWHAKNEAARFPNAEIVWCQEEPMNMGAWSYVCPRLETALRADRGENFRPKYVGRIPSASPATGSPYVHQQEQDALVAEALAV